MNFAKIIFRIFKYMKYFNILASFQNQKYRFQETKKCNCHMKNSITFSASFEKLEN